MRLMQYQQFRHISNQKRITSIQKFVEGIGNSF